MTACQTEELEAAKAKIIVLRKRLRKAKRKLEVLNDPDSDSQVVGPEQLAAIELAVSLLSEDHEAANHWSGCNGCRALAELRASFDV